MLLEAKEIGGVMLARDGLAFFSGGSPLFTGGMLQQNTSKLHHGVSKSCRITDIKVAYSFYITNST